MKSKRPVNAASVLMFALQLIAHVCGTQFASHVSVNTPAHSFTHGVGDPLPTRYQGFRSSRRPSVRLAQRSQTQRAQTQRIKTQRSGGYPRVQPVIPFNSEEVRRNGLNSLSWPYDIQMETSIPVLPPSPYKVDSPDPESLWPEGLFLPPLGASRFGGFGRRTDSGMCKETDKLEILENINKIKSLERKELRTENQYLEEICEVTEPEIVDPYLLEGSEAIGAVKRARDHGIYYFHDIPHIESLFANQDLRVENGLKPHRVASIRHTWPYNRP